MNLNNVGAALLAVAAGMFAAGSVSAGVVNVYSHRHYAVDQEINKLFTEKTGIEVKVVNAPADQLLERLRSEGENSPADLLITVDAGRMQRAKAEGLLQPLESEVLSNASPANLRDAEGYWHSYTVRSRVILVSKERVNPGEIETYEQLADPKWRGRLLINSASSNYNQSLMASLVAANGKEAAEKWARGVVSNMARPPQGGDRDQIKTVASGLADVCVSNTYYLGLLLNSPDPAERAAAESVRVVFPNQNGRGAHCNVGAAGVTKHAKNLKEARAYLEFLVSPEVQKIIANGSYEFPVGMDLTLSPTHAAWGGFKMDAGTFAELGENQPEAIRIFDAVGWK